MLFGQNRDELRRYYLQVWHKHRQQEPLQPLEQLIAEVVGSHPEYHPLLENEENALARDYGPQQGESNPFLHMGMHLAIREQLMTDRPPGLRAAHAALSLRLGDPHQAEHQIMECLGQALWEAQRAGRAPDEQAYLECVRKLT